MSKKPTAAKKPAARSIPPALHSDAFLLRADDIESPMHEAWTALEFARQFVDLMLLAESYQVDAPTLEFASGALTGASRELEAALSRVRRVSCEVLVADPNVRSLDEIGEALKARDVADAEAVQR
jgi:hypothetical protein